MQSTLLLDASSTKYHLRTQINSASVPNRAISLRFALTTSLISYKTSSKDIFKVTVAQAAR